MGRFFERCHSGSSCSRAKPFNSYFRHLKPEGVLALHISNRYLDLKPVCEGGAASVGRQAWVVEDEGDEASYLSSSTWVLVTSDLAMVKGSFSRMPLSRSTPP